MLPSLPDCEELIPEENQAAGIVVKQYRKWLTLIIT